MLVASIFLPSSHWVDREEDGVTAGKGEWREWEWGRERERKKHVEWEWGDRQEERKERTQRERGGGDWLNYDQGTTNTHLARCFISSPRTCRFLSGSLWTRQWTAWMRDSGLPPSVQTQKQPYSQIKLQGFLCGSSGGKEPTQQLRLNTVQQKANSNDYNTLSTFEHHTIRLRYRGNHLVEEFKHVLLRHWTKVSGLLETQQSPSDTQG